FAADAFDLGIVEPALEVMVAERHSPWKPHMWLPHGPCAYGSHESAGMTFYAGCARCGFSWIPRINGEKSIAGTTHAVP
ncbi:hypothetical protein AAAX11_09345, partial [Bifidobacterium adolescentis]